MALVRPRRVGVESLALWAMEQVDFAGLLASQGLTGPQRAAAIGSIVGRMAAPASERATHTWLGERSGLGELLDVDYEAMGLSALYRASDRLLTHKTALEAALFQRVNDLFGLSTTVTLYDLTNTYFEGEMAENVKAQRGHSKEKRTDCPLVTLGLVLAGSGFVRRSEVFEGNVSEGQTLEEMLEGLEAPAGALVVMDPRCPPWRAKRRRVVPGSREATRETRRAEGAKGDPKGASERGVQSYGRPVCSRNELAMLWRNAG